MGKVKQVCIYARVSTGGQTVKNQLRELREVASRHGWVVVDEYCDEGVSGTRGRDARPQFDAMCKAATRKDFDMIMAWSVDRLSRSLPNLVTFMTEVEASGVGLFLHKQAIDTTTPTGKMMLQMCGVFAEFEAAMIKERVMSGLARARSQGRVGGRPKVSYKVERKILAMRTPDKNGRVLGIRKIATQMGIGTSTVQRVVAA